MATYRIPAETLRQQRSKTFILLYLKYFLYLLTIFLLLWLEVQHNDQRHRLIEAIALVLMLLLLGENFFNAYQQVLQRFGGQQLHYEITLHADRITRRIADHQEITLHVAEIVHAKEKSSHGLGLYTTDRRRKLLIPNQIENLEAFKAELGRMGVKLD
ncbi:MAG: hypothetical protein ACYC46_10810 [Acidobacteriaceae bacterium]